MKRTYAFILACGLLMGTGLSGCTSENTTGVDTEGTTNNAVDGQLNNPDAGTETQDNISPLDTADSPATGTGTGTDTTQQNNTTVPTGNQ